VTLPKGWRETETRSNRPGTWRFQVRSPKRFRATTLRTVVLEKIRGVKLIAGKLLAGDHELARHGADAMVPQAVVFSKADWPQFRDALQWQRDHFTAIDNPRPNPYDKRIREEGEAARMMGVPREKNPYKIAYDKTGESILLEQAQEWLNGWSIPRGTFPRRKNPPKGSEPQIARAYNEGYNNGRIDKSIGHRSDYAFTSESGDSLESSDSGVRWRTAYTMGYRDGWNGVARRRDFGSTRANPPHRLEAFRLGATEAIVRLVTTETELQTLMVQALELADRGAPIPEWIRTRARGLQLEKMARLEDVKTAVARHGAAIEEFSESPAKGRRANPAGARADAVRMFKQFHGGRPPTGYRYQRVPDLSQLVTLGRVVSIDYQLEPHVARGKRNTPYRHAFDRGSTLLTDPTGRALVIVGNVKVSRSPRGRFGYIRAASEV